MVSTTSDALLSSISITFYLFLVAIKLY